jgi:DNA-binding NarL/FixJ family response regulator
VKKSQEIKSVFIVDDHPVVRTGLRQLVEQESDLTVCGEEESGKKAIQEMKRLAPHIALVDISLKDMNGLELIKQLKISSPDIMILVVSMHDENVYAERALRAGARGYVMKQEAPQKIIEALHKIVGGEIYLSASMSGKMISKTENGEYTSVQDLTDRELQVFELIGNGLGTSQIAVKLGLSVKTVETYKSHLKEKLNLLSGDELNRYAIQYMKIQK